MRRSRRGGGKCPEEESERKEKEREEAGHDIDCGGARGCVRAPALPKFCVLSESLDSLRAASF